MLRSRQTLEAIAKAGPFDELSTNFKPSTSTKPPRMVWGYPLDKKLWEKCAQENDLLDGSGLLDLTSVQSFLCKKLGCCLVMNGAAYAVLIVAFNDNYWHGRPTRPEAIEKYRQWAGLEGPPKWYLCAYID